MARRKSKNFIQSAIKRKGALSGRAKRSKRSTLAQARHDKAKGTPQQKAQANFYLNVLKPSSRSRKSKSGGSMPKGRKRGSAHKVKAHTRVSKKGKRFRVKSHGRKNPSRRKTA